MVAGGHGAAAHTRRLLRRAVQADVVLQAFQERQQREGIVSEHAVSEYIDIAVAQSRAQAAAVAVSDDREQRSFNMWFKMQKRNIS